MGDTEQYDDQDFGTRQGGPEDGDDPGLFDGAPGGFTPFGEMPYQGGLSASVPESAQFPVRSGNAPVAANPGFVHPPNNLYTEACHPEANTYWTRCITARSQSGSPFDLRVEWTGGEIAMGGLVTVTASGGSTRVYVEATSIVISAATWNNAADTIYVGVSDRAGGNEGSLHRVQRAINVAGGGAATNMGAVPPYAKDVQVLTDTPAQLAGTHIRFLGPGGVTVAEFSAALGRQPVPPSVGGVQIVNTNPGAVNSAILDYGLDF